MNNQPQQYQTTSTNQIHDHYIVQWNCNGFYKHLEEIQLIKFQKQPLAILLQETHTKNNNPPKLTGYHTIFKNSQSGNSDEGVAILLNDNVEFTQINLNTQLQAVALLISYPIRITLCSIYLHVNNYPTCHELAQLSNQLTQPYLIGGDFNAWNPLWGSRSSNRRGEIIEQFLNDMDLNLLNNGNPTYFSTRYGTYSNIDLTIVSPILQNSLDWNTDSDLRASDHYLINIKIVSTDNNLVQHRPRYIIKNADWNAIIDNLNFFASIDNNNTDVINDHITNEITACFEHFLKKSKSVCYKPSNPWWNNDVAKAIRFRKNALRKFNKYPTEENLQNYLCKRDASRDVISSAKKQSWSKYVSEIDTNTSSSEMWQKIRSMSGKKKTNCILQLTSNNNNYNNDKDIGNILSEEFKHFSSNAVFENACTNKLKLRELNESMKQNLSADSEDYNNEIECHEFYDVLKNCKGASPGIDNISYDIFKHMDHHHVEYIISFFNKIWCTGSIPDKWKVSIVIPILKPSKPKNDPSSYRPIALTNCICKIYEKIIGSRLKYVIEKRNLFSNFQFGFRKNRSTQDAIGCLVENAQEAIYRKQHLVAVLLDIEKAYDRTWHEKIINQLLKWKFKGNMMKTIENFLVNRTSHILIGNTFSNAYENENGIPQGSVLSVILFLVAINGITECVQEPAATILFADDITIYTVNKDINTIQRVLQKSLNSIASWTKNNGFILSATKTIAINFNNKHRPVNPILSLNGNQVKFEESVRYLGVTLDRKLKWKIYVTEIKTKCIKRLQIIRSLAHTKWGANQFCLQKLYNAMILPLMDYGDIFYNTAAKSHVNKLNFIQNSALRLISGAFRTTPVNSLEALCGYPDLCTRRMQHIVQFGSSIDNNTNHPLFSNIFVNQNPKNMRNQIEIGKRSLNIDPLLTVINQPIYSIPPWLANPIKIDFSMTKFKKETTSNQIFKCEFAKICHKYSCYYQMFTDGSKTNDGVGCAVWSENISSTMKLSNETSIFSAESKALFLATDIAVNFAENRIVIFCDSLSALKYLKKTMPSNPDSVKIINMIKISSSSIIYVWIPSHIGIIGNENADKLAKEVISQSDQIIHNINKADFKNLCKRSVKHMAELKWTETTINNKLREIKTSIRPWDVFRLLQRKNAVIYARIVMGHSSLTHKYLLDREAQPTCSDCQEILTIKHILFDCQKYNEERMEILQNKPITDVLKDDFTAAMKTIEFLTRINLIHNL